jgi:ABC-type multidrug transport system fused ATPase/permease subunit
VGLSGGQKARVALARALYSRTRILLLDDPIAALDHHTAETIIIRCFAGPLLKDRIVVLVTHRLDLVRTQARQFIKIADGRVEPVDQLDVSDTEPTSNQNGDVKKTPKPPAAEQKDNGPKKSATFMKEEHRENGGIKAGVWIAFLRAAKYSWIGVGVTMGLTQFIRISQQWFYKSWGEAYAQSAPAWFHFLSSNSAIHEQMTFAFKPADSKTTSIFEPGDYLPPPQQDLRPWLVILLVLGIMTATTLSTYACAQLIAVYSTSKNLFAQAIQSITHATFRFYDVTPAGQLMNKLTSDMATLDGALNYFGHTIFFSMLWLSSVVVVASISPFFLVLVSLLTGAFVSVFRMFLPTSRSLKRLETTSLSPLFTRFGELLQSQGLTTVRAFHVLKPFEDSTIETVDNVQTATHFYWSVQNWLTYRYQVISATFILAATIIALTTDLTAGLTAFMLVNAQMFVFSTQILCLRFGDLQTEFVSVERVVELIETEQEPPGSYMPPAAWPRFGANVVFDHVTLRYAPELDPSLQDISLEIPGGKITAVIGRTGSGKSTLVSALLNIVRVETGSITIDGVSLTDIDVNTLRRRVTFIPQDPVLFDGTIRENLDPVGEHSDEECAAVLARIAESANQTLSSSDRVEPGGRNFSQGQRQLLGITRAVLRRSPIIILDEATASIDLETSAALQNIIREEMREATVITIAHRAEAVAAADYVVELEAGRVKRQGGVAEMLPQEN